MSITLVKKIKVDGNPCRKCADVLDRLERAGLMGRIDSVVVADERDPESEGMRLAAALGVDAAPFFIVTEGEVRTVYVSYVKLLKEVLSVEPSGADAAMELLAKNADLDNL